MYGCDNKCSQALWVNLKKGDHYEDLSRDGGTLLTLELQEIG
jgi:hypothetical protein